VGEVGGFLSYPQFEEQNLSDMDNFFKSFVSENQVSHIKRNQVVNVKYTKTLSP